MDGKEYRVQPRINWHGSVRLTIPNGEPIDATIADISEMGWGVRTEQAVSPGAEVGIDGVGFYGSGIVRYCYPHHGAFRIGIQLLSPDA